jgi:beta-lactamase regulating signal transducer with metallopeptidase domain
LRHVFLHELAHLQRHDIAVGWILAIAQSLHWFNPIVWYAIHHARADRELATDELALHHAQLKEHRPYAETIIKMLDQFSRPAPIPAIAGILEDQRQMARRIRQIARFGSKTKWHALSLATLLLLALVSLPDARENANSVLPTPNNLTTPSLTP